jgi:hypothetical protein
VVGIFVNLNGVFNLRRLHTGSGLQDSDVIISDAPRGNFTEISSSSYELSLFSWKAGSGRVAGVGTVPEGSSSWSIGDLWLEIDNAEDIGAEGASITRTHSHFKASTSRPLSGTGELKKRKIRESSNDAVEGVALEPALGLSYASKKGHGENSMKGKAA